MIGVVPAAESLFDLSNQKVMKDGFTAKMCASARLICPQVNG